MNEFKAQDRILLVDDEAFYIQVLIELLTPQYQVTLAKSGEQALQLLDQGLSVDLILLDVMMPGMSGYDTCRAIKANPAFSAIPVIFLTIKSDVDDEIEGFACGACDYITKPFSPPIVTARVATHLSLRHSRRALEKYSQQLEHRVRERTEEISRTQDVAIYCMASLAETRDNETGMHIRRTQHYVREIALYLQNSVLEPGYGYFIDQDYIELLFKSAPLHDLGKVGVPDRVLLKPGSLDADEWQEMQKHAEYGYQALMAAEREYGSSAFLSIAKEIAFSHHERWDGKGYPQGLHGADIPLSARIMALADCYDALISRRVYKAPMTHQQARDIIVRDKGSHFDPTIVDAFIALEQTFIKIAAQFSDEQ